MTTMCVYIYFQFSTGALNQPMTFVPQMKHIDALYMVLNFYIKFKLTQEALVELLRMVNVICGAKNLPESYDSFLAHFQDPYGSHRVYFCCNCQCEFGPEAPSKDTVCSIPSCNSKKFDFFMVLPVEQQIKETVLKYKDEIDEYETLMDTQQISDINRGDIMKAITAKEGGKFITLSVNTDGAAAYRWTINKPCYPIFVVINNLPPRLRFNKNNIILAGIWLSKGEPYMPLFFKKMCTEVKNLKQGIKIGSDIYKVVVLQTCLDTVARPKLQNSTQFNGKYGCSLCMHEGKVFGTQVRYPFANVEQREHALTKQLMMEIQQTKIKQFGIKGPSVFLILPDFDIISGKSLNEKHFFIC